MMVHGFMSQLLQQHGALPRPVVRDPQGDRQPRPVRAPLPPGVLPLHHLRQEPPALGRRKVLRAGLQRLPEPEVRRLKMTA